MFCSTRCTRYTIPSMTIAMHNSHSLICNMHYFTLNSNRRPVRSQTYGVPYYFCFPQCYKTQNLIINLESNVDTIGKMI